jgi:multiple sugar transport system substrate-binding protein
MQNVKGSAPILHFAFCILHFAFAFLFLLTCAGAARDDRVTFWALGREGEEVAKLMPEFERRTGIKVDVQQIPWTAAHEKLLTAYVGEATPDVAQVGNTWIPEFSALRAIEDLTARASSSRVVRQDDYFPGIWDTNVIAGRVYGMPWYVDTRVLFYRTDVIPQPPRTWSEWVATMDRLKQEGRYAILLPTSEWAQPTILALQMGSPLLKDDGRYGAFRDPEFVRAFEFYLSLFRRGYAPSLSASQISNKYQQFAAGDFAMFISGPWDVGESRDRLPKSVPWMTAPLPTPDGKPWPGLSLAGGSSLVIFKDSPRKEAAWKLIEYLSEPEQQARFYELLRDLPARKSAWSAPALQNDPYLQAFRLQLERVMPLPKVPESERIVTLIFEQADRAIRGQVSVEQAVTALDTVTNEVLTKRRWMIERGARAD